MSTNKKWPFDQSPNCASITLKKVINKTAPILHVVHDLEDHGWQFLGLEQPKEEDAAVVGMETILKIDPSVEEVAHIPPGWRAWRKSKETAWIIEKDTDEEGS